MSGLDSFEIEENNKYSKFRCLYMAFSNDIYQNPEYVTSGVPLPQNLYELYFESHIALTMYSIGSFDRKKLNAN